jgi:hypothetical protein
MKRSRKLITICGGKLSLIWLWMILNICLLPACAAFTEQPDREQTLASSTDGTALSDALPLLNAMAPSFLRVEPAGESAFLPADYYQQVPQAGDNKVFRFKALPIPVYVSSFPDADFVAAVGHSFDAWESRSGGTVRFVTVDEAAKARIQVVWKHLGREQDDSGCVLGAHTITRYPKAGAGYGVPPQVIEVNLDLIMSKHPSVRYRLLQNVVTHELGHALGILGHSPYLNDMMYAVTDEHSRLSHRDINTLIKLYQQKADVPL